MERTPGFSRLLVLSAKKYGPVSSVPLLGFPSLYSLFQGIFQIRVRYSFNGMSFLSVLNLNVMHENMFSMSLDFHPRNGQSKTVIAWLVVVVPL